MKSLLLGAALLCSLPTLAGNYNDFVKCSTSSNGYSFSDKSRDASLALEHAVSQCKSHSRTSNAECSVNVSCNDGSYTAPMVRCNTSSNGYSFHDETRSAALSKKHAIKKCTAHSRTSNAECNANVACNDGSIVNPIVKCQTSSNGYSFSDKSRDINLSTKHAIAQCKEHSKTSNAECDVNVSCNDGSIAPAMVRCETSSNGYRFSDKSRSAALSSSHAITQCKKHSKTSNAECSVNVSCNDGSYAAPMVKCGTSSNGYRFSDRSRSPELSADHAIKACKKHSRTTNRECSANIMCEGGISHRPTPPRTPDTPRPPRYDYGNRSYAFKGMSLHIANRLINIVEQLEPYTNIQEYEESLLPIKKQAGRLKSRVNGRAKLKRVKNTLLHLSALLDAETEFIENLTDRDALFNTGVELDTIRESVKSLIRTTRRHNNDRNQLY